MAVMYSKLGGCLGVTAKLGPLARTDLWAGVKGLLERLMTHLGLGSSLKEPWVGLLGVWKWCCLPRRWCWPPGKTGLACAWGAPITLPCWPGRIIALPCMGGARGLRWAISLTMWKERSSLGRAVIFPRGKVSSSWERIASFPRRKVSNCQSRKTAWCLTVGLGWTVTFRGRVNSCRERIASFPGRKVSNCQSRKTAWCLTVSLGWTATFQGKVTSCRGRIASFPGRKVSSDRGGVTRSLPIYWIRFRPSVIYSISYGYISFLFGN